MVVVVVVLSGESDVVVVTDSLAVEEALDSVAVVLVEVGVIANVVLEERCDAVMLLVIPAAVEVSDEVVLG